MSLESFKVREKKREVEEDEFSDLWWIKENECKEVKEINFSQQSFSTIKDEDVDDIKLDFIIGSNGDVYKVDSIPSLHNMTNEERVNYAKRVISNYNVNSAEYKYYNDIINQNNQQKNRTQEDDPEYEFIQMSKKLKKEKSYEERMLEYLKNYDPSVEKPKRTTKELFESIKQKIANNKSLDDEEQELYNSLKLIDDKTKDCEMSGELHFRRRK